MHEDNLDYSALQAGGKFRGGRPEARTKLVMFCGPGGLSSVPGNNTALQRNLSLWTMAVYGEMELE